jgi:hypothetical protein
MNRLAWPKTKDGLRKKNAMWVLAIILFCKRDSVAGRAPIRHFGPNLVACREVHRADALKIGEVLFGLGRRVARRAPYSSWSVGLLTIKHNRLTSARDGATRPVKVKVRTDKG